MCEELEKELEEGDKAARLLVEHLERMGAAKANIPLETDNGCYHIEVKKVL